MSEWLATGVVTVESEFQGGLTGACGPNACANAARWSDMNPTFPRTTDVNAALQKVVHSPNGVSDPSQLMQTMHNMGYSTLSANAGESGPSFANRVLEGHLGVSVAFYALGQNLVDYITGDHEDASGLHGHFNTLFGRNSGGPSPKLGGRTIPAGYWVGDGDNNIQNPIIAGARDHRGINGDLDFYPDSDVISAQMGETFAILARKVAHVGVPAGWSDDTATATLKAPNGVAVVKGFRDFVLANGWNPLNWPLNAEYDTPSVEPGNQSIGPGSRQEFRFGSLGWTQTRNVYMIWIGQDYLALQGQLATAKNQIVSLNQSLIAANATIVKLQAELAAASKADIPGAVADLHDALTKLGG